jgi:MFS family permease
VHRPDTCRRYRWRVRVDPRYSFFWHAFFLAVTTSFTEVNTVMPALVMSAGGTPATVGALTAVMIGLPLVAQLVFAGFLSTRPRKKPYLLLGISLRVAALGGGATGIALFGTGAGIIPSVFAAMTVFALSGAFAGVSYTSLIGTLVPSEQRRQFFVRRQIASTTGLLLSAVATKLLLGTTDFPDGYVLLFALAAGFLFIAQWGFWPLREDQATTAGPPPLAGWSGMVAALKQAPKIWRSDANLRTLVVVMNLIAVGFTSIPLLTAMAHETYKPTATTVGTFVLVHITGMLLASPLWSRVIRRGGYRLVLQVVLVLVAVAFPASLVLAATQPVMVFAGIYLVTGAITAGQKIAVDGAVVQLSPDDSRALYAGLFGAANLASAILPLVSGALVSRVGFPAVLIAAAVAALVALVPVRRLDCGSWYHKQ